MRISTTLASGLVVVGLSAFLLGEDVEREPVVVEPPRPVPPPPLPPPPKPPSQPAPAPEPPGSRPAFLLPGPQRLDFSLPREVPQGSMQTEQEDAIQRRLEAHLRDLGARWRAQGDLPHSGWRLLVGRIQDQWRPDLSQIRDERITTPSVAWLGAEIWRRMRTAPSSVGDTFQDPADNPLFSERGVWVHHFLPGSGARGADPPVDPGIEARGFNEVAVMIEIRFGPTGAPEDRPRLIEGSGHPLYDRAALAGVERALEAWRDEPRPPGPARAVVALRGKVEVASRLPLCGLGFDLILPLLDPVIPARTTLATRVDLVALYGPRDPRQSPMDAD